MPNSIIRRNNQNCDLFFVKSLTGGCSFYDRVGQQWTDKYVFRRWSMRMISQLPASLPSQNGNLIPAIQNQPVQENGFHLSFKSDSPGLIEEPAPRNTIVAIHYGASVEISCRRGGYNHRGIAVHGDIDVIPAGTPSTWELRGQDTYVALRIPPELLDRM